MAISGKFEADFSSFQQEVNRAVVSLDVFQKSSEDVAKSLSRMADRYSGQKIIEKGLEINRLFTTTQDLALLTEKELAEVGRTAAQAADKMQRMGLAVPENLRHIADAAGDASSGLSMMGQIAGSLGIVTSITEAVSLVKQFAVEIINSADALNTLHERTGISIEGLQDMQDVADKSGTTIEAMASAVGQLEAKIGTGDKGVTAAFAELGINMDEFLKLDPDERFFTLARAVGAIEDPIQQARVASELFGKTWKELVPALKAGFQEAGNEATHMSDATVKALNDMKNVSTDYAKWAKSEGAYAIASFWRAFTFGSEQVDDVQVKLDAMRDSALKAKPALETLPPLETLENLDRMGQLLDQDRQNADDAALAANAYADAVYLASDAIKALHEWTTTQAKKANAEFWKDQETQLKANDKNIAEHYLQIADLQAKNTDFVMKQTLSETDYKIAKIKEWEEQAIRAFSVDGPTAQQLAAFTDAVKERATQQIDALKEVPPIVTLIGQSAADVEATRTAGAKATGDVVVDEYRRQQEAFLSFKGVVVAGTGEISAASTAIQAAMQGTDTILRDWLIRNAQLARGEFFMTGMSQTPYTPPTRQAGGPVSAGHSYLVGEQGPELFRPASSGMIVPNGGGVTVHNTFYVNGSIRDLALPLMDELSRMMKQTRQWPSAT
jgi:hypothetical protein